MKMKVKSQKSKIKVAIQSAKALAFVLWLCALTFGFCAFAAPSTNKTSGGVATNAPAAELPIPQSVFELPSVTNPVKDPFFPRRRVVLAQPAPGGTPTNPPVAELTLHGFSVDTRGRPLAIIQDHTFSVGEEGDVTTVTGVRVHVRCLEIHTDDGSCAVEVAGQQRQLRLGRKK